MASDLPMETANREQQVHRMEIGISYVLRIGVVSSAAVVLAGLVMIFVHHGEYLSDGQTMKDAIDRMSFPRTFGEVVTGLAQGEGRAIITLGLFMLIATPVARVVTSILVFFHQRDRLFTWITAIVLLLLLGSFFLGRAG